MIEYKYVRFENVGGKTDKHPMIVCVSIQQDLTLGMICYHGNAGRYVFDPHSQCSLYATSLVEIGEYIIALNAIELKEK